MRQVLTVHEPVLVNTLGHSAGTLIFATFLYLLLRDRAGARLRGSRLTLCAATLAFLWNATSLAVLAAPSEILVAISSSALSLLPAVLLHLSLGDQFSGVRWGGYLFSGITILIHLTEPWFDGFEQHLLALRLTTYGFGALTLLAVVLQLRSTRTLSRRLAGTMSLFLFSLSFAHFGIDTAAPVFWPVELVAHHAGIALALFVLLQDYRFLLLDAFVRLLASMMLAAGFVFLVVSLFDVRQLLAQAAQDPFQEGMLIVCTCLLLLAFAGIRRALEEGLQKLLFPRPDLDVIVQDLRGIAMACKDENEFLATAGEQIAQFLEASVLAFPFPGEPPATPCPVADLPAEIRGPMEQAGAQAILPLRLSGSEARVFLFGRRRGGRRYLSEDFAALSRVQAELTEQLKAFREAEMRRLVSQAEFRALQSQIHPHFLFNALNTLYGVIPREAKGARQTVLNLADIFRYFLRTDRAWIPLQEELLIVQAYLEIESLRLGPKLRTEINVAPEALAVPIPVLTIQPLVENAVKHGVAAKAEGGAVRLEISVCGDRMRVLVADTGAGFDDSPAQVSAVMGARVGLDNVIKRLELCYGPEATLEIQTGSQGTQVRFEVPLRQSETKQGAGKPAKTGNRQEVLR
ncbi:MAG: histidine kinase [Bryobacteraceae bacterium]|nr:histidine kinase [Bryobacteraceae bacterium]MDW8378928.1 histidine kinase [Bryobacterales bacterium]